MHLRAIWHIHHGNIIRLSSAYALNAESPQCDASQEAQALCNVCVKLYAIVYIL